MVKFIYSEKATKFYEIFPLLLTVCTVVKSKGKISQDFVAFSEYMNFNSTKFVSLQFHEKCLKVESKSEIYRRRKRKFETAILRIMLLVMSFLFKTNPFICKREQSCTICYIFWRSGKFCCIAYITFLLLALESTNACSRSHCYFTWSNHKKWGLSNFAF